MLNNDWSVSSSLNKSSLLLCVDNTYRVRQRRCAPWPQGTGKHPTVRNKSIDFFVTDSDSSFEGRASPGTPSAGAKFRCSRATQHRSAFFSSTPSPPSPHKAHSGFVSQGSDLGGFVTLSRALGGFLSTGAGVASSSVSPASRSSLAASVDSFSRLSRFSPKSTVSANTCCRAAIASRISCCLALAVETRSKRSTLMTGETQSRTWWVCSDCLPTDEPCVSPASTLFIGVAAVCFFETSESRPVPLASRSAFTKTKAHSLTSTSYGESVVVHFDPASCARRSRQVMMYGVVATSPASRVVPQLVPSFVSVSPSSLPGCENNAARYFCFDDELSSSSSPFLSQLTNASAQLTSAIAETAHSCNSEFCSFSKRKQIAFRAKVAISGSSVNCSKFPKNAEFGGFGGSISLEGLQLKASVFSEPFSAQSTGTFPVRASKFDASLRVTDLRLEITHNLVASQSAASCSLAVYLAKNAS
mmetsp:Transcript_15654/g.51394  ORF Transcript_15654/g.51394 Transcript_15654/m.51394 type:complete len:473 (-) Transcript_15654:516-1934(-)